MAKANEETILAVKLAEAYAHLYPGWPAGSVVPPTGQYVKNSTTIADDAATLKSMARSLHRIAERQCNGYQGPHGGWDETTEIRDKDRESKIRERVIALAAEYGITRVDFNGDPRGYAVRLHFPDRRGNTMGGDSEGWGI